MSTKSAVAEEISSGIPPRYSELQPRRVAWILWSCVLAIGSVATLYFFNPAQNGFYPVCTFYKTTGLLCPGCGTLRAAHQLLHGHVEAAFRFNALIVSSLPFLALGCVKAARHRAGNKPALGWIRPSWLWIGLPILVIFGVLRNLPGASHYFLAPLGQ